MVAVATGTRECKRSTTAQGGVRHAFLTSFTPLGRHATAVLSSVSEFWGCSKLGCSRHSPQPHTTNSRHYLLPSYDDAKTPNLPGMASGSYRCSPMTLLLYVIPPVLFVISTSSG